MIIKLFTIEDFLKEPVDKTIHILAKDLRYGTIEMSTSFSEVPTYIGDHLFIKNLGILYFVFKKIDKLLDVD